MNVKIVTFVPVAHADSVRQALGRAGAGQIGEYSYCSFSVVGQGRFKPSDSANPHIGTGTPTQNPLRITQLLLIDADGQWLVTEIR